MAAVAAAATMVTTGTKTPNQSDSYFAIRNGLTVDTCIFLYWNDCEKQVDNYPEAEYAVFEQFIDAIHYIKYSQNNQQQKERKTTTQLQTLTKKPTIPESTSLGTSSQTRKRQLTTQKQGNFNAVTAATTVEPSQKRPVQGHTATPTSNKKRPAQESAVATTINNNTNNKNARSRVTKTTSDHDNTPQENTADKLHSTSKEELSSSSPSTCQAKRALQWDSMLNELRRYKAENNGKLPNAKTKRVGAWLSRQRQRYWKQEESGKHGVLTPSRIQTLRDLGVDLERKKEYRCTTWEDRLQQLRDYKKEHGNCQIPIHHPTLGSFVKVTRKQYLAYKRQQLQLQEQQQQENGDDANRGNIENNNGDSAVAVTKVPKEYVKPLSEERIRQLNEIGFVFNALPNRKGAGRHLQPITTEIWDEQFETWKQHMAQNNGKMGLEKGTLLERWVKRQKQEYAKLQTMESSVQLTASRLARLNAVGFVFHDRHRAYPGEMRSRVTFDERIEQLVEFKAIHGHAKVPKSYTKDGLADWSCIQRQHYRKYMEGESSCMNQEKIQKLTEVGFAFQAGKRIDREKVETKTWDERFEELLEFRLLHGHTRVPQSKLGLGSWVCQQRKYHKKIKDGQKAPLTAEQILKLQGVGFVFNASPYRNGGKRHQLDELNFKY